MREVLLDKLIEKARTTKMAMIGINVSKYNLSNTEKHYLANKGLHLGYVREGLLLTYPHTLRADDLRNKIMKGR